MAGTAFVSNSCYNGPYKTHIGAHRRFLLCRSNTGL